MPQSKQPAKDAPRPGYERVRLVTRPDQEIELREDEVAVLRYQGLVAEDERPAANPADSADGAPKE